MFFSFKIVSRKIVSVTSCEFNAIFLSLQGSLLSQSHALASGNILGNSVESVLSLNVADCSRLELLPDLKLSDDDSFFLIPISCLSDQQVPVFLSFL